MGKEQLKIQKESVEEYEKITIKEEPFLTDINNIKVVANLQIKSEPIDNVEQDLPINQGENVIIKEEFSEIFVKSETLVDTSELCNIQMKNEDPLEVHDRKSQGKDLSSNTIWANPSEGVKLETQEHELSLNTTKKKKFQCTICLKNFSTKGIVIQHISRAHPLHFKKIYAKAAVKQDISKVHEGEKLENQDQDLSPNTTEENKFQYSSVHQEKKEFKCSTCFKLFPTKTNLKRHIALVHEKAKLFKCGYCTSSFGTKFDCKSHVAKVHITKAHDNKQQFQCGYCPSRFGTKNECIKHVAKIHEKNKPNQCPNCPARFEYSGELYNHLTLVHGGRVFNA
jgi:hypothetical protein